MKSLLLLLFSFVFFCCNSSLNPAVNTTAKNRIQPEGKSIATRIGLPEGYYRVPADSNSFGHYLRNLPLKADGSDVLLYTGESKPWQHVHVAVIDMEIGNKDLQQCADACIRMRAEYLWKTKQFDKIQFHLTNGFNMEYTKWKEGNRLKVKGNETHWEKTAEPSNSYATFRKYLDTVFMYAGTLSVAKELKPRKINEIQPGDVFVVGGSPGHAVMAVDVAENDKGERIFLLAQGYMPAQEIHIIKNPNDEELSPWFDSSFEGALETIEWRFSTFTLGHF